MFVLNIIYLQNFHSYTLTSMQLIYTFKIYKNINNLIIIFYLILTKSYLKNKGSIYSYN